MSDAYLVGVRPESAWRMPLAEPEGREVVFSLPPEEAMTSRAAITDDGLLFLRGGELVRWRALMSDTLETVVSGLPFYWDGFNYEDPTDSVAASPDGQRIYVATAAGDPWWEHPSKLFVSTDGGATFSEKNFDPGGSYVKRITLSCTDTPGVLFAKVNHSEWDEIYVSTDGGDSWNLLYAGDFGYTEDTHLAPYAPLGEFQTRGTKYLPGDEFSGRFAIGADNDPRLVVAESVDLWSDYVYNTAGAVFDTGRFVGSSLPDVSYRPALAHNYGDPYTGGAGGTEGVYIGNTDGSWGWMPIGAAWSADEDETIFLIGSPGPVVIEKFWTDFSNSYEIP